MLISIDEDVADCLCGDCFYVCDGRPAELYVSASMKSNA